MSTLPRKHIVVGLAALTLVLIGAIVGLVVTSGGGASGSARNLTLQPNDLPPDFVLTEEKLYSREELLAKLSADAQAAKEWLGELYFDHQATEAGLQEAIHLTYESQEDIPIVDVFVFAYEDEDAAEAAHSFARASGGDTLRPVDLGSGIRGGVFPDAYVLQGMGDDALLMTGYLEYDDGDENTLTDSLMAQVYFMRSGSARAEVLVAGESIDLDPEGVARNQYLRLESPEAVVAP